MSVLGSGLGRGRGRIVVPGDSAAPVDLDLPAMPGRGRVVRANSLAPRDDVPIPIIFPKNGNGKHNNVHYKLDYLDGVPHRRTYIAEQKPMIIKGIRTFKVTSALHPTFFHVRLFPEGFNVLELKELYFHFQSLYNQHEFRRQMERSREIVLDRVYAWRNTKYNVWDRVRVVQKGTDRTVTIYTLDSGILVDEIDPKELYELSHQFATYPPLAYQAYLVDIEPRESLEVTWTGWSDDSSQKFRDIIWQSEEYRGIIAAVHTRPEDESNIPNHSIVLGLILLDNVKRDDSPNWTLNARLVEEKLAEPNGLASATSFFKQHRNEKYKMFANVLESEYDKDEVGLLLSITSHARYIPGSLYYEEEVDESEPSEAKMLSSRLFETPQRRLTEHLFPEDISVSLAKVHITHFESPSRFFGILVSYVEELYTMMSFLGGLWDKESRSLENFELEVGDCVIANHPHPPHARPPWHRAFILQFLEDSIAKVFLVDFGMEFNIEVRSLIPLPECFSSISTYCFRFHIDGSSSKYTISPTSTDSGGNLIAPGKTWSPESTKAVKSFIGYNPNENTYPPTGFAFHTSSTGILSLPSFYQDPQFDPTTQTWTSLPDPEDTEVAEHLPIEASFYISHGIDFAFEVPYQDMRVNYKFVKLTDFLLQKEFAIKEDREFEFESEASGESLVVKSSPRSPRTKAQLKEDGNRSPRKINFVTAEPKKLEPIDEELGGEKTCESL